MDKAIAQMFEAAARVANEWSLAAFTVAALALVVLLVLKRRTTPKNIIRLLWGIVVAMVVLAVVPPISRAYLETHGIYRLRVTVEDSKGMPVDSAHVISSIGGEPKKVEGGWEFDIPVSIKPPDGKLTIYAEVPSAFLSAKTVIQLANDYSPAAQVRLEHDTSAHIRGSVVDDKGNPVPGVQVTVAGYETEAVFTGDLGQFDLAAHASEGQEVELLIFKKGLGGGSQWAMAGNQPATITLKHR